jgi:hypothetical protein
MTSSNYAHVFPIAYSSPEKQALDREPIVHSSHTSERDDVLPSVFFGAFSKKSNSDFYLKFGIINHLSNII